VLSQYQGKEIVMNLNQKLAVVTGGGRGIGRGISEKLLSEGCKVLVAQRQVLDDELMANPQVHFIKADLSERQAPYAIAAQALSLGGADILVNNAGVMFEKPLQEMLESDWDYMIAVNMRAPAFLAKALLEQMAEKKSTSIINIGSIEGLGANPQHAAYCASKAGIHGLTRALAVDLGGYGIRCNAIAPGWINTDLSHDYINAQDDPEQARVALNAMHPAGRTGEPADIGAMVAFLASEEATFITGQIFTVDGGRTAKLPLPF
jgi:NAD(P)-dependent dehydrogenase (short-subunit alcohol dehydrogenase family)